MSETTDMGLLKSALASAQELREQMEWLKMDTEDASAIVSRLAAVLRRARKCVHEGRQKREEKN